MLDNLVRNKAMLGSLPGSLTVDIPVVVLASVAGTAASSAVSGTALGTALEVGSFALGPMLVAFGVTVGYRLSKLVCHYKLSDKLGAAYNRGLARLADRSAAPVRARR